MRERPIIFSAPMVRAILAGAKTMTRRIIKPQPPHDGLIVFDNQYTPEVIDRHGCYGPGESRPGAHDGDIAEWGTYCPFGGVGDRLWVKEGVVQIGHERPMRNGQYPWPKLCDKFTEEVARNWLDKSCFYTADEPANSHLYDEPHGTLNKMFMPRWASRITLEITGVKVERLQDISEEDAIAEGVDAVSMADVPRQACFNRRTDFKQLWEKIHGPGSWEAFPWVWAITFRKAGG